MQTFSQWYSKVKPSKAAYFWTEIRPLLELCWNAATPVVKGTRSQAQNKYYWGVVCKIIGDEVGYIPDEMHQLLAKQFLSYESKGEMFVKSTTKLNTAEMETYLENVRRFAATELSCFVPLPSEYEIKPKGDI
jgi:hypothetical protein